MKKTVISILLFFPLLLVLTNCEDRGPDLFGDGFPQIPAVGEIPERVELPQEWDRQTREDFWWTSQGSRILPYSWFVYLEMANDTTPFRSAEHMESLRYLPIESSKMNPGGLPIGFTISEKGEDDDQWLGMTCAACHTNQIDFDGTKMLIEGAPTLADFPQFFSNLVDALQATNSDDAKFDRFARKVLSSDFSSAKADSLRNYLEEITLASAERQEVNSVAPLPEDFTSYARLDAFGEIMNAGTAFALNDLSNRNTPSAPVSYPFLWGTHQSDVVQWNASAKNTPIIGPLVRNVGEVVGVFGNLSIKKDGNSIKYNSTVNYHNLGELEKWVKELGSPAWPEDILPPIDTELAARGATLFSSTCSGCHQVIPRDEVVTTEYVASKVPINVVGTDPQMAIHSATDTARTLALEGTKKAVLFGKPFNPVDTAIMVPVNGVIGLILHNPLTALEAGLIPYEESGKHRPDVKELIDNIKSFVERHKENKEETTDELNTRVAQLVGQHLASKGAGGLVYKARPLNGIWATAPFLHNGSVPNLWELLKDPSSRVDSFWVGSREFDPENVGFKSDQGLNLFRTRDENGDLIPGNSNMGHNFGTTWTNSQKRAVIEYLKTL